MQHNNAALRHLMTGLTTESRHDVCKIFLAMDTRFKTASSSTGGDIGLLVKGWAEHVQYVRRAEPVLAATCTPAAALGQLPFFRSIYLDVDNLIKGLAKRANLDVDDLIDAYLRRSPHLVDQGPDSRKASRAVDAVPIDRVKVARALVEELVTQLKKEGFESTVLMADMRSRADENRGEVVSSEGLTGYWEERVCFSEQKAVMLAACHARLRMIHAYTDVQRNAEVAEGMTRSVPALPSDSHKAEQGDAKDRHWTAFATASGDTPEV
ncbi:hypothetical protein D9615_010617 [Tricholomella constricta]|uniref:Uncharacterized protein n=1 Tax=Tricholomella constricta TaxID=117010 RepID=A0A8H5GLN6_9AGAR|nr:hypothetical protein D9615_010617 [Tricholomella constricta]